ncbi:MlaD family protein [Nocardia sp. NPDC051570]|uniref:MlaD family protein n=1 Tax=Nocardia sp. NPDC051570 TaxID=3364324 RepID=UPI0037B29585
MRRIAVLIGVVIVAVAAGVYLWAPGKAHYTVEFAEAAGVSSDTEVRVAGITVGAVTGLRLAGTHVDVDIAIDRAVRLGADSRAELSLATVIGGTVVRLTPAGPGSLRGGRIPVQRTGTPYQLSDLIGAVGPALAPVDGPTLRATLDEVTRSLSDQQALPRQLIGDMHTLAGDLAATHDQVQQVLTTSDEYLAAAATERDTLTRLTTDLSSVLTAVKVRRAQLDTTLHGVTDLLGTLQRQYVEQHGRFGDLIERANTDIAALTASRDGLDRVLTLLGPLVRSLGASFGNGPYWSVDVPQGAFMDSLLCQTGIEAGCK